MYNVRRMDKNSIMSQTDTPFYIVFTKPTAFFDRNGNVRSRQEPGNIMQAYGDRQTYFATVLGRVDKGCARVMNSYERSLAVRG